MPPERTESLESNDMLIMSDMYLVAARSPVMLNYVPKLVVPSLEMGEIQNRIVYWANYWDADPLLALAIVSCEGGFTNPNNCNKQYGCIGGQGHFQFIPSRWLSTYIEMDSKLPNECRNKQGVFNSECNIMAGTWLLARDGDRHWRTWSGHCYLPKYRQWSSNQ